MFFIILRFFLILGIVSFFIYYFTIVVVPENSIFIQERLGRYHRTLSAGFHFQFPFVDKIAYKPSGKEQTLIIKSLKCETADGLEFSIDSVFVFQIQDPIKAVYETENYGLSILQEIQRHIIAEIHNHHSDEIFARRYGMNQSVVKHVGEQAKNWGIKIIRFEIQQMTRNAKIT